jgi:enamine deaminase RidA (YjgF/YER057c/UK114 family)
MIKRIAGSVNSRSRVVIADSLIFTVATAAIKSADLFDQTRQALEAVDKNLAESGSSKEHILCATVYISDMSKKGEMNRAWEEWVDSQNAPVRVCVGATLEGNDLVEIAVTALTRPQ